MELLRVDGLVALPAHQIYDTGVPSPLYLNFHKVVLI